MYDILKLKTYQKPLLTITTIVTYGVVLSTYIGESFRVLQNELCYNVTRLFFHQSQPRCDEDKGIDHLSRFWQSCLGTFVFLLPNI